MANQTSIDNYLLKPTGLYGVSFKDFHWINDNLCPDPNFSKERQKEFSSENKKYCHEIMVRIYYPTSSKIDGNTPYYRPIIRAEQSALKEKTTISTGDIKALSQLKSYTINHAQVIKGKKFPVILFVSGLGGVVQLYENIIAQLVSHGYIVVGINSAFISGDIALPDDKIISAVDVKDWSTVTKTTIPILENDIAFVYKKIQKLAKDKIINAMDLKHIGAMGHSFGGRAIANVTNQHKNWFQALATLDMEVHMGSFEPKSSTMPYMHIISAYWKTAFSWKNIVYPLNKNGYLVTLSPSQDNKHYSYHMNFTDLSTLQYMPVYQDAMAYDHAKLAIGEDVIVKIDNEKLKLEKVNRPLYLIVKNKKTWSVFYYEPEQKPKRINLENIPGLQVTLDNSIKDQLTESNLAIIKQMIHAYHQRFGNYLGKGNGWELAETINLYLVDFFNTFLEDKKNPFVDCDALTQNTLLECDDNDSKLKYIV